MSSTGIRRIRSTDSRTADSILAIDKAQLESEKIFAESNTTSGNNGVGISNQRTAAGNYLKNSGDIRLGPMGNDISIVEIVDDNISVDNSSLNYTPYVLVGTEGGVDDDLTSITTGTNPFLNQELTIQSGAADSTLTIKEDLLESPGILTPNSVDISLELGDTVDLVYSVTVGAWIVVGSSIFGEGTGGDPTVLNNLDSVDHGSIGLVSESFDLDEGNFHFFEASGDVSITFTNLPVSGKWEPILLKITQDVTGGHAITFTQTIENGSPTISTIADDITVVKFYMYNDGTSDIIRAGDWDASGGTGGLNTNLSNLEASAIPTVDLSMNGQQIVNVTALDIEDTAGATRLGISGPLGVGVRFDFVLDDTVFFTENSLDDILSINTNGLNLLTNDITMGDGGNIIAGGAAEGMTNIGHLDFVDNEATPVSSLSIYSDGTDVLVNTGGSVVNLSDVGDGIFLDSTFRIQGSVDATKQLAFEVDGFATATTRTFTFPDADGTVFVTSAVQQLDMNSNSITNASYIESDTANRPGDGFIRMAFTDELRMRNSGNDDDVIIKAALPTLNSTTQDAISFTVASEVQMYIGQFDISVQENDIVDTGDILVGSGTHQIGTTELPYNQMYSEFFVPEAATITTNRYGLSKTGNQLYINYDSINADAGLGVYEQGIQQFRFYNPTITETELQFGPDIFESGETYRIVFGANSAAKGMIEFTDAGDLILERTTSTSTLDGVRLRTGGITYLYATSTDISILNTSLNLNSNEIENVVNITSNGGGGATTGVIGELITVNGGFNYFMRDTLAWESDVNKKLTMTSSGITLETDGATDNISIITNGITSDINLEFTEFLNIGSSTFPSIIQVSATAGVTFRTRWGNNKFTYS